MLQEIRGQCATDSCAKPNLRLTMLPRTTQNNHLHVKPAGSTSNNAHVANAINSLSIYDDKDTENARACVVNTVRGYNDDDVNATSNYRNGNCGNASNSQPLNENESNDINDCVINAFRNFNKNRNNDAHNNQRSNGNARFNESHN